MSRLKIAAFLVLAAMSALLLVSSLTQFAGGASRTVIRVENAGQDPDAPPISLGAPNGGMSREEFMLRRAEYIGLRRGFDKDHLVDPKLRQTAIATMEAQQQRVAAMPKSRAKDVLTAAWTEIGPNPIPNGQVIDGPQLAVSGRTVAIAVHPTNPNIVYVGAAQGGLFRTTNGGATWTPLLDNAMSLAIGAIAIAPSQPDTIYVGTGEPNFSADCFFGVGIYRITNASTVSPVVSGPFNKDAASADVFTGTSVGKIAVDPTNPNNIFVGTTFGIGGIGGALPAPRPPFGIFRCTNATTAAPVFEKLSGVGSSNSLNVTDVVIGPDDPNRVVVAASDPFGVGGAGIYLTTDALAATPTFGLTQAVAGTDRVELSINRVGATTTIFAATGEGNGRVYRSLTGGASFTTQITNGFCGGQCFYDVAIAVDPGNANRVYLGGTGAGTTFAFSTDGGASFNGSESGLHTDSHVIAVAPSLPSTLYFGSDGGIYKSTDSGATWSTLNNTTYRATQFMSIAVHPTDPNFSIGGTQDNGTNFYQPNATWTRADFGDGGYSLIDQNAPDTVNVRMYHTYFNASALQGYATVPDVPSAMEGNWDFVGCSNNVPGNGIPCGAPVLFYAPLEQGPGNPNAIYYGTNVLYRSIDSGTNHTPVSQAFGAAISAIGISLQNDNVRIVGLRNGNLFGTTTGANPLTNLDPTNAVPNNFIGRAVIDPNNVNIAYVTLSGFGVTNVWKTTNLNGAPPTWTAASGSGGNMLPQAPVNAFIVDPTDSNALYAGTDIGVFTSTDAGANWTPFGTGLPRVAVFDMAMQPTSRTLRIATHGRGMWQIALPGAFQLTTAVSRKTHGSAGTFDVALPLTGNPGIECRNSGGNHTLVFSFSNSVVSGSASVISGTGSVSGSPTFSANTMTVNLTGVTNVQQIAVKLSGVTDSAAHVLPDNTVNMIALAGDTTANKAVNSGDVSQTKTQSGSLVGASNFRNDVTTDGSINASDVSLVKTRVGTAVP
jgi:hypothetical protein